MFLEALQMVLQGTEALQSLNSAPWRIKPRQTRHATSQRWRFKPFCPKLVSAFRAELVFEVSKTTIRCSCSNFCCRWCSLSYLSCCPYISLPAHRQPQWKEFQQQKEESLPLHSHSVLLLRFLSLFNSNFILDLSISQLVLVKGSSPSTEPTDSQLAQMRGCARGLQPYSASRSSVLAWEILAAIRCPITLMERRVQIWWSRIWTKRNEPDTSDEIETQVYKIDWSKLSVEVNRPRHKPNRQEA